MGDQGKSGKSVHQKAVEGGYAKVYPNGVVGYHQSGQPHDAYKEAMKPLKGITATDNDLLSKYFGKKP